MTSRTYAVRTGARIEQSSRRSRAFRLIALLPALLLACTETGAPALDVEPVTSPTSRETIALTGRARGAETVEITRVRPASEADAWSALADPFSGIWHAEVPLVHDSENEFEIVAVDAAGRRSDTVSVRVAHEAVRAHGLELVLSPNVISTAAGAVQARVTATHPESGVDLSGLDVALFVGGGTEPAHEVVTDALGRAEVFISGFHEAGTWQVTATLGALMAEAMVEVVEDPSAPATVEVVLEAAGYEADGTGRLSVPAGTIVDVVVTVRDGEGTVIEDVDVSVETDAPGADYAGGDLVGLERAGTFVVVAAVPGTSVWGAAALEVLPGEPAEVDLWVSHAQVLVDEPVRYRLEVRDAFGNLLSETPVDLQATPSGQIDADDPRRGIVRFDMPGEADLIATVGDGGDAIVESRSIDVGELGDAAASVRLLDPVHGDVLAGGAEVSIRVEAAAAAGIAEVILHLEQGDGSTTGWRNPILDGPVAVETTFEYPAAAEIDLLRLTATVVDRDGRRVTQRTQSVLIHPDLEAAQGYEIRYVAGGPGGDLSGPTGLAATDDGRILLANFGADEVLEVDVETGAGTPFAETPAAPRDVVWDPVTGDVLVSHADDGVARFTATGELISSMWAAFDAPWAMTLGPDGLLYVVASTERAVKAIPVEDRTGANPNAIVTLGCGGALIGNGRGVALDPDAGDGRALFVTSTSPSGLHRCTDDGSGADQDGEYLTNAGLGYARHILPLSGEDVLVANAFYGSVVRLSPDADGAWDGETVLDGLNWAVGIVQMPNGRVLVGGYTDNLLVELILPD